MLRVGKAELQNIEKASKMKVASSFFVFALAASLGSAASADEYIIGEGVNPGEARNKPRLTVKVDGQSGGKTFSPDEASGMTVTCTIDVSGANQAYCSTGYHVYYSDRLSLTKNKLGNINVVPGADQEADNQALAFTNNNAPKEDPTVPEGWKGFFVSTAGNGNVGLDGTMWKFSFKLPDDLQGGEVFPIDILYKVADSAADMFASASPNSPESKNMEAYLFTKGIYTASNPNPFGVEGLPADADGYIAIAVPPPVVSNVVARQRWPWNGLVDVDYEIGGETKGFKAEISFDEQGGLSRHWTATNFLAGAEPTLNRGYNRATWDAKAAGATNVVTEVQATVKLLHEE